MCRCPKADWSSKDATVPASTPLGKVITGTGTVWNGCIEAVPGPQFRMLYYDVHLRQRWQSTHHIRQTISLTHDCCHMPVPGPGTWWHAGVDPPDGWHGYEPRVRQIVIIFSAVWRPLLSMTRARPLIIVTSAVRGSRTWLTEGEEMMTKRVIMVDRGVNIIYL